MREAIPRDWKLPEDWEADMAFDGGSAGCGELVLNLRLRFRELEPGTRVAVRATDRGAPLDLPAWCRVTGHALIAADHPFYLMRVRERQS